MLFEIKIKKKGKLRFALLNLFADLFSVDLFRYHEELKLDRDTRNGTKQQSLMLGQGGGGMRSADKLFMRYFGNFCLELRVLWYFSNLQELIPQVTSWKRFIPSRNLNA